jgi:hypothetical protein
MNRQPFSGVLDWSGCRTMLGLNKADASNEYSKKIRADQAALRFIQFGMRLERLFHLCRTRLEDIEQIPVTTFEILDHVAQSLRGSCCIELKNSADDMVGPSLIGWVEVSGFSRRFEGSDDNPSRIRAQI